MGDEGGITADQLSITLENMATAWEKLDPQERLFKCDEKSFFEGGKHTCEELIDRWHTGESSHPDADDLAALYPRNEEGFEQLWEDIKALKDEPMVAAADLRLRIAKYTKD